MSTYSADELIKAALKLPESDRIFLATELFASLPAPPGVLREDDPGFFEELDRRSEELRRDPSTAIPWEDAIRSIQAELDEGKANRDLASTESDDNCTTLDL